MKRSPGVKHPRSLKARDLARAITYIEKHLLHMFAGKGVNASDVYLRIPQTKRYTYSMTLEALKALRNVGVLYAYEQDGAVLFKIPVLSRVSESKLNNV